MTCGWAVWGSDFGERHANSFHRLFEATSAIEGWTPTRAREMDDDYGSLRPYCYSC